jgi:hypothetical protein
LCTAICLDCTLHITRGPHRKTRSNLQHQQACGAVLDSLPDLLRSKSRLEPTRRSPQHLHPRNPRDCQLLIRRDQIGRDSFARTHQLLISHTHYLRQANRLGSASCRGSLSKLPRRPQKNQNEMQSRVPWLGQDTKSTVVSHSADAATAPPILSAARRVPAVAQAES